MQIKKCLKFFGRRMSCIVMALIAAVLFSSSVFAASFNVYSLDTVAGTSTSIKTSQISVGTKVSFQVKQPNGEMVNFSAYADGNGIARVDFSDYYTRSAGDYSVLAYLEGESSLSDVDSFKVYSGSVSGVKSQITPGNQVLRTLDESANISVKLFDDYGNPIEGHLVKLLSSSESDFVSTTFPTSITDKYGEVDFEISSDQAGSVVYTAYDVSADLILSDRAKVAYFTSGDLFLSNSYSPENYSYAASGNSSGAVDHFEFENLPSDLAPGDNVSFTVVAYDDLDEPVIDYSGTIRLSTLGENAVYASLPDDYTFTPADQGSHTFSLALTFQQPGTYAVEARDLDDIVVFGEYLFEVVASSGASNESDADLAITSPIAGTYSNNVQVISGNALPGDRLKIFDNDIEIASLIADAGGEFSYTTATLVDGMHSVYIATVNEVGTLLDTSEAVQIKIDTEAPEITQVVIEPSGDVGPGDVITVKLYTPDNLSQAALVLADNIYDFTLSDQGYFEASLIAPGEFGQYPMSFILVDQLGNESRFDNEIDLSVGAGTSSGVGDVSNVVVTADDHRVILNWGAPEGDALIQNYRVFYGISPNKLTEAVDTFTNTTTWYIPNLKNELEYYMAVVAVDEDGNISEHFSNIVAATPGPPVVDVPPPEVTEGSAGAEALDDMESDVSEVGPSMFWLLMLSLIGGVFYGHTVRRRLQLEGKKISYSEIIEETSKVRSDLRDCLFK